MKHVKTLTAAMLLLLTACAQAASPRLPCPAEIGYVAARVNVNEGIVGYAKFLGDERLIVDLQDISGGKGNATYASARTWLHARYPKAQIGTYISSRYVTDEATKKVPVGYVRADLFAWNEFLPPEFNHPDGKDKNKRMPYTLRIADFRQPQVRAQMVAAITEEAVVRKSPILFTDEWSPLVDWQDDDWTAPCKLYMAELTKSLHVHGILHIPNLDIPVGDPRLSMQDIHDCASNADGLVFEQAAPVKSDSKRLLDCYWIMANTNCRAIMLGNAETSAEFLAGLSALGGFQHYVVADWTRPLPEWANWPAKYGKPIGSVQVNGMQATRQFEGGTCVVDFEKRTASEGK